MPTWEIALGIVVAGLLVLVLVALRLLSHLRELGRAARRARGEQAHAQALQANVAALQQRMAAVAQRAEAATTRSARPGDGA